MTVERHKSQGMANEYFWIGGHTAFPYLNPTWWIVGVWFQPLYCCAEFLSFFFQGGAACVEELVPCRQEFDSSVAERH